MDQSGRDKVESAIESAGINMDLIAITPSREEIPPKGVRFLTIHILERTGRDDREEHEPSLRDDVKRSLRYGRLLEEYGADEDGPSLAELPNNVAGDSDIYLEDTNMRGTGVQEDEAQKRYARQYIDTLDLGRSQYDKLRDHGLISVGLLGYANPAHLIAEGILLPSDVDQVNAALEPYGMSMGCKNDLEEQ